MKFFVGLLHNLFTVLLIVGLVALCCHFSHPSFDQTEEEIQALSQKLDKEIEYANKTCPNHHADYFQPKKQQTVSRD